MAQMRIGQYLDRLASDAPTPGGGSACGLVGTLAAALGQMVAAIAGRREGSSEPAACARLFRTKRDQLLILGEEDAAAFDAVMDALRIPKEDPERAARLARALVQAAEIPLRTAAACVEILDGLANLLPHATRHVASDVGAAAHLARAAAHASLLNVTINLSGLRDAAVTQPLRDRRDRLASRAEALFSELLPCVMERMR